MTKRHRFLFVEWVLGGISVDSEGTTMHRLVGWARCCQCAHHVRFHLAYDGNVDCIVRQSYKSRLRVNDDDLVMPRRVDVEDRCG